MKTPKPTQKYDLHEMYSVNGKQQWKSTVATNLPYAIIRHKMNVYSKDTKYPKGTFFLPVPNGITPLQYLKQLNPKTMNILYSDSTFPTGRYEGQLVENVMQENPHYIKQQAKQSKQFCFSDEVIHQLNNQTSKEYKPRR